jgi:hypothetical protein
MRLYTVKAAWAVYLSFLCLAGAYILWEFHPWTPAGTPILIRQSTFSSCEFQIWQRKNDCLTEPFATGLFVRHGNGPWKAYLIDIQDLYRPSYRFRKIDEDNVGIQEDGVTAFYRISSDKFFRPNGGTPVDGSPIKGDPPSNWWLEP